jgi:hypothetical protein
VFKLHAICEKHENVPTFKFPHADFFDVEKRLLADALDILLQFGMCQFHPCKIN